MNNIVNLRMLTHRKIPLTGKTVTAEELLLNTLKLRVSYVSF